MKIIGKLYKVTQIALSIRNYRLDALELDDNY